MLFFRIVYLKKNYGFDLFRVQNMMFVVDWDLIFFGFLQKLFVELLYSLVVYFDRSVGKDVKQKYKFFCNIKRWLNLLIKDLLLVLVVNVLLNYVYMMNG